MLSYSPNIWGQNKLNCMLRGHLLFEKQLLVTLSAMLAEKKIALKAKPNKKRQKVGLVFIERYM